MFLYALTCSAPAVVAQDQPFQDLQPCYEEAVDAESKYACFGSTVKPCMERSDGHGKIQACVRAEADAWDGLLEAERERIAQVLTTGRIVEGPCAGNEMGCFQGLAQLMGDGKAYREAQCAEEAKPENAAGRPELAFESCRLRELARQTLRVWEFGQGMGRAE